jgi:hypothetical protein
LRREPSELRATLMKQHNRSPAAPCRRVRGAPLGRGTADAARRWSARTSHRRSRPRAWHCRGAAGRATRGLACRPEGTVGKAAPSAQRQRSSKSGDFPYTRTERYRFGYCAWPVVLRGWASLCRSQSAQARGRPQDLQLSGASFAGFLGSEGDLGSQHRQQDGNRHRRVRHTSQR